ncbi:putative integral membrane protein (apicoplast) [Theileria parva strain Muguga]|uniref:Uncharacterized protein n=1 Tax=Theileria parva TaxID=5875 RepID=Q4MYA1_THEPA|nr:putative integral membrane protein [Theileria parva strain Muguga]|eukprot:XP_762691.1 hypothetical protein (apicoplast) [Theileria parva strain Muguga]
MINNKNKTENIVTNNDKQIKDIHTTDYIIDLLSNIINSKNIQNITENNNISHSFNIETFYKLYEICTKHTIKTSTSIKTYINIIIKFIKLLIIYLIEKYYYNFNDIYFILKSSKDIETFNFYTSFNNLKTYLNSFIQKKNKPGTRLSVYYIILLLVYIYFGPISWFLIRVLTDAQNWMEHTLDTMVILPLPFIQ